MGWLGHLRLDYMRDGARTIALDRHDGPLRVLQRLYPEGDAICHHVLVHPPGGIVGGDELNIDATLAPGTHALITTPSATRFYRSNGPQAVQQARLAVAAGARLEWLPLETLAYRACQARNEVSLELSGGAEALGWDVLALGLPAAGEPFDQGCFEQRVEMPGRWLERGRIDAADTALLNSPLGWAGHRVMGTLWFAAGQALDSTRREALLEGARSAVSAHALARTAGCTSPQEGVVILRVLGARVEPVMQLLQTVRAAWRQAAWNLSANPPRVWRT